jgi:hypothetical protein
MHRRPGLTEFPEHGLIQDREKPNAGPLKSNVHLPRLVD